MTCHDRTGIDVHNVTFGYTGVPVVADVSFSVPPGRIVGLIGPNGSGKSTLLRLITNVLTPHRGYISIGNKNAAHYTRLEMASYLAVVQQEQALDFDFTVKDVVAMGRMPHVRRFAKDRSDDTMAVQHALALTDLTKLGARSVTALSGGERQRVAIARALAQQPRILLLDEPTSHLDIRHQADMLDLVARLNRDEGLTVLIVLHDLNLAALYCDTVVLLAEGRVVAQGRPTNVISEAIIHEAYNASVTVMKHPRYDVPTVHYLRHGVAADDDSIIADTTEKSDQRKGDVPC